MGIALLVYIAEIANGIKTTGGVVAFTFGVAAMILHAEAKPVNRYRTAGFWCMATALLGLAIITLVPTSMGVYKIAGVSAQEQGRIDAMGKIKP